MDRKNLILGSALVLLLIVLAVVGTLVLRKRATLVQNGIVPSIMPSLTGRSQSPSSTKGARPVFPDNTNKKKLEAWKSGDPLPEVPETGKMEQAEIILNP